MRFGNSGADFGVPDFSSDSFAFSLDSEMWRVNHQKCGLFFGPAAAILQIAHPRIAQGVADHSNFESDTMGRLDRTLAATNRIAFGTTLEAEAIQDTLTKVHFDVKGQTPADMKGRSKYSAFEPDLLLWVLATMIMAARQGYEMVEGPLSLKRQEMFYREMRHFGTFFGLDRNYGPADTIEFDRYYSDMISGDFLGSHPLCTKLARAIATPQDSAGTRIFGRAVRFLTIETLPEPVRGRLGFYSTSRSRSAMWMLRKSAPAAFRLLPRKSKYYPEAVERISREKEVKGEPEKDCDQLPVSCPFSVRKRNP